MIDHSTASGRDRAPLALLLTFLLAAALPAADSLTVHDLARLRHVSAVAAAPDGQRLAYLLSVPRDPFAEEDGKPWSELHVIGADGASRPYLTGQVEVSELAWTPDGGALSFVAKRGGDEHDALYRIPIDGGEARRVVAHGADIGAYSWAPDGRRVAFLATEPVDPEREELEEKGFDQEVFEEDWRAKHVWVADLDSDQPPRRLELPGSASELRWSPAGDALAVALAPTPLVDDGYMRRRLHVVAPDGGAIRATVEHEGKLGAVAWSPDGRRLAFLGVVDLHDPQEGRLLVVEAGGGAPRDLLPGYLGHVSALAWADASTLVWIGDEGVRTTLNAIGADGSGRRALAPADGPVWIGLSLSRDGATAVLTGETPGHPEEVFRLRIGEGDGAPVRLTDSNPWLAERRLAVQEVVDYRARDGLALTGLLVRPLDPPAGGKAPLVVMVHGGPEAHFRHGWLSTYSRPAQVLAGRGIASFYPNYRGSTGRGVEFSKLGQRDSAGAEFDDLVDGVDHLVAAGLADPARVGITGGSYGGYATAWGATYYSEHFAAGVMFVGTSELISKHLTSDIPHELHLVHERYWPWEEWQLALERSPLYHVRKSRTPLLILHGRKDTRVFPGQSLQLYRALRVLDQAPVRLVFYPDEAHGNRKAASRLDFSVRAVRWLEHYLVGAGGEPPPYPLDYRAPGTGGDG